LETPVAIPSIAARPHGVYRHQHRDAGLQRKGGADHAQADAAAIGGKQDGEAENDEYAGDADEPFQQGGSLPGLSERGCAGWAGDWRGLGAKASGG
jgi:hypothetical protein